MTQHIAVRAIIRKDEKTLLLRRANGRQSIQGKYELPGGKLEYGEQPEDALARYLKKEGLEMRTAQLFDVLTYIDHDHHDVQYVFILYLVGLGSDNAKVRLSQGYDHYVWNKMSNIQQSELTESAKLLLGISQQNISDVIERKLIDREVSNTTLTSRLIVYSDGGSRGNPGPSAAGFIVMNEYEYVLHEGGMYLGVTTNNQAEYHGVLLGLEKALSMGASSIDFRLDSSLVVNQLNGVYRIKNRDLWPIHERIVNLMTKFNRVTFTHVKREFNQLADGMVNKILDARSRQ